MYSLTRPEHKETADQTMEVEIIEDVKIVAILKSAGDTVPVGTPIAILYDGEEDIKNGQNGVNLDSMDLTTLSSALWQAYLKP